MKDRQQSSTSYPMPFLLVSSTDHVTPVTGATPTVTISKNGAAFGAATGSVAEIGNGWYALAGNATDRATLGELLLHATAAAADPADDRYTIVPWDPFDGSAMGLSRLDAAVSTRSTFAGGAVASVTAAVTVGTNNDKTGYALTVTPPTAAQVRTEMDANSTKLANLDAAVSTRSTYAGEDTPGTTTLLTRVPSTIIADIAAAVWGAATRTLSTFGFSVAVSDKTGFSLTSAYDAAKTAAQVSEIPTSAAIADKILGRAIAGGADGGRTVGQALAALRNKVTVVPTSSTTGTMTVYADDDTTVLWSGAVTLDATATPITAMDPA